MLPSHALKLRRSCNCLYVAETAGPLRAAFSTGEQGDRGSVLVVDRVRLCQLKGMAVYPGWIVGSPGGPTRLVLAGAQFANGDQSFRYTALDWLYLPGSFQ